MKRIISILLCSTFLTAFTPLKAIAIDESTYVEHLKLPKKIAKKSPTNLVKNTETTIDVASYNVLPLVFAQDFTSKTAKLGDEIVFLTKDDIVTTEGTLVLPAGSHIVATITDLKKPKSFNRSGKVYLTFNSVQIDGEKEIPLNAKVFSKKEFLSRGKLNALGKSVGSLFGGLAVGTAAGCGIGIAAGAVVVGGLAIGLPIGVGVGVLGGSLTPGLYYKAKAGDSINIQLVTNLVIDK